jgi:Uma2 family endonuclease
MSQALRKLLRFEEFTRWKPEHGRYELHDGVIVKMPQPLGGHEEITGFLIRKLSVELARLNLPYLVPKTALVKPPESESGYSPDVLIVNQTNLIHEPLWQQESTVTQAASIPLVVEVVSTNWRDDYHKKYSEYEAIGIPEYWIFDYLALGNRLFIGKPKQPTILICSLDEGEYQISCKDSGIGVLTNVTPKAEHQKYGKKPATKHSRVLELGL